MEINLMRWKNENKKKNNISKDCIYFYTDNMQLFYVSDF